MLVKANSDDVRLPIAKVESLRTSACGRTTDGRTLDDVLAIESGDWKDHVVMGRSRRMAKFIVAVGCWIRLLLTRLWTSQSKKDLDS